MITRAIHSDKDFISLLQLFIDEPYAVLLDSSLSDKDLGRYSFFMCDPIQIFEGNTLQEWTSFKTTLRTLMAGPPEQHELPFVGGVVGIISYDFGLQFENIQSIHADELNLPGFTFGLYDVFFAYNHATNQMMLCANPAISSEEKVSLKMQRFAQKLFGDSSMFSSGQCNTLNLQSDLTSEEYKTSVTKALDYIAQGDIYQVNLSQRFVQTMKDSFTDQDAVIMYQTLRSLSASGFAAYLKADHFWVLSSSPERFLQIVNGRAEIRPMKGTCPRAGDEVQDQKYKDELMASEKDQAELLMITDLERNDLGRVCEFGSVYVDSLRTLEQYQTVYQTTSTVRGTLRPECDAFDAIEACFPGGSITGCPKIRSMNIINELEKSRRNFYTGSLGYISFNGNMDMNILIRTLTVTPDQISFHVGGGIVADSDPIKEYEETMVKSKAMRECLSQFFNQK